MKGLFFLITLFFFTSSYGQDYPKMVVEGATWIYQHEYNNFNSYNFHVYHIKGDTIVNGIEYSIVNLQDFNLDTLGFLIMGSSGLKSALLREDTLNKKVFAIILDESILTYGVGNFEEFFESGDYENEYLLYDFSLEIGDTLASPNFDYTIFDIESVEKFNYNVQKFSLDGGNDYFEKFGGEYELFAQLNLAFVAGAAPTLIHYCVSDNFDCEVLVQPLSVNNLPASDFKVYPNPANDIVTIKVPNEKIQSLQLFSPEGKLIYTQKGIDANEFSIDLTAVNYTGLIYIEGITTNSRFVERLMKF